MIYIPQLKIRFGPTVIEGNPGIKVDWEQTAKELEKMFDAGIWSVTGKILDVVGASDLALTFAEIGMPLAWGVGMSVAGIAGRSTAPTTRRKRRPFRKPTGLGWCWGIQSGGRR